MSGRMPDHVARYCGFHLGLRDGADMLIRTGERRVWMSRLTMSVNRATTSSSVMSMPNDGEITTRSMPHLSIFFLRLVDIQPSPSKRPAAQAISRSVGMLLSALSTA